MSIFEGVYSGFNCQGIELISTLIDITFEIDIFSQFTIFTLVKSFEWILVFMFNRFYFVSIIIMNPSSFQHLVETRDQAHNHSQMFSLSLSQIKFKIKFTTKFKDMRFFI